jgi:phosphatidylinositol alpha-mannosyltransferase
MRIAIVTDYYYPALGGITEHVHGQATALHRRGHEVTVITGNQLRPPKVVDSAHAPEKYAPFEILRIGISVGLYGNASQTLHTIHPLIFPKLRSLLRQRQFDVIHTHAPYNPSFVQAVPFVAPPRSVTVGTFHSVFPKDFKMSLFGKLLRPSIDRLDARIVVSDACIESLEPYFPYARYVTIPNGVDECHFTPEAEPLERFRDGRINILFLGRFDPRNGLDTMLRAFTKLYRSRPARDVRLIVVGDGPLRAYYRRQVPDDVARAVEWVGLVNWERPRYLASADILCAPCDRASFGMVVLEAMSCGTPIVASANSGFQLLMSNGRQGILIPEATNAEAFAEALTHLANCPEERARMGAEGRATAVTAYSWSCIAERLEAHYESLIREKRRQ